MNTLLHCCCGPCLGGSYPILEKEIGTGKTAVFWENPNIHPYFEYIQRMNSFIKMSEVYGLKIYKGDVEYGLSRFLNVLGEDYGPSRCEKCYRIRLYATAKKAAEKGFDSFSTTLLISPYQNHELLQKVGNEVGEENKIKFLYVDFRPGFRSSHDIIRQYDLYKQKYCGCIFSEYDRYINDKKAKNQLKVTDIGE